MSLFYVGHVIVIMSSESSLYGLDISCQGGAM